MFHDEADRLRLPLHVVHRGGEERHGAVLRGAVTDLSITKQTAHDKQEG